ncbi:hypothetical protein AALA13_10015 [Lachnospiraceae bacterium 50-23]|jgi:hypothetical protein|nr:hypothetical protein [Dorea sp.]
MKKHSLLIGFMICMLVAGVSACAKEEAVFRIEDTEISTEQFNYYISKNRSDIISQYQENAELIDEAFWARKADGEATTADVLKEKAKQECLYDQMLLIIAQKKGIADSHSFEDIRKDMEEENQERKEKIESGRIVYGNKSYSVETYMSYYFSNLIHELMKEMEDQELKFTDEELMQYCLSHNKDLENIEQGQTIRSVYGLEYKRFLLDQFIQQQVKESNLTVNRKVYDSLEIS